MNLEFVLDYQNSMTFNGSLYYNFNKGRFYGYVKGNFPCLYQEFSSQEREKNLNNLRRKMPSEVYINLVESKHSYNVNTYNQFL